MKTIALKLALALLAVITAGVALYILFYIVIVAALLLVSHYAVYQIGRGYQRFLRWQDDRAHQAFIDDVMATAKRKAPASASIHIG